MATRFLTDLAGTFKTFFRIGTKRIKDDSQGVRMRNSGDTADVAVAASALKLNGSSSGVATIQVASAAGTPTWTLPTADGSTNQVLSTNGSGVLSFQTVSTASGELKQEEETIAFGDTSPRTIFTPPAGGTIERVIAIVDTAFDGTATLSVGIAGTTSKYMATTENELGTAGQYEVSPMFKEDGTPDAVIITYSAGGATVGSVRVIVQYGLPVDD